MMLRRALMFVVVLFSLLMPAAWAQLSKSNEPTPAWLSWLVFHDSLAFYSRQSPGQDARILTEQFKLSPTQAETVLSAGRSFTEEMRKIENDEAAEIKKRYLHVPDQTRPPAAGAATGRPPTPQKSIRERAIADGLFAEIESRKEATLTKHMQQLRLQLGEVNFDRIQKQIQTAIAPGIKHIQASEVGGRGQPTSLSPAERMR